MGRKPSGQPDRAPRTHADLLRRVKEDGARIEQTQAGHLLATWPDGERIHLPLTPSDRRSALNSWAQIKRRRNRAA